MKILNFFLMLFALSAANAYAASSAQQVVTMSISAINEIAIAGSAPSLAITTAAAGSAPTSTSSSGITYAITTNESNKKITGSIDSAMPSGTTLSLSLAAPTGSSSAGAVNLSTSDADLVTGISLLNESNLALTYTFAATPAAGVLSSFNKTVTITIVDGS